MKFIKKKFMRLFRPLLASPAVSIADPRPTYACAECGRVYGTTEHADWCRDWDRVLGVRRHELKP